MLVYDHHVTGLTGRLTRMQHDSAVEVVATMHVHMDHHNCLEVLVLRGAGAQLHALGQKLLSFKGVRYGSVELGAIGEREEHQHETD
jgi:CopG family transcriptional regulator, nickel-responsive regulator